MGVFSLSPPLLVLEVSPLQSVEKYLQVVLTAPLDLVLLKPHPPLFLLDLVLLEPHPPLLWRRVTHFHLPETSS
ncbi:hypothetical protein JCGZ_20224 [Jatropha curcas]|uniref:Uncharacterized protein n=1 Tax=Jatropha curcas TaxID=180498 RepID=A0A067K562_JATCU|nr:hypothetical protein JCGZ_20224 [Jatropha curcas]